MPPARSHSSRPSVAQHRNSQAVQRLFDRQAQAPPPPPAPAAGHHGRQTASAAEVVGTTLSAHQQPAWSQVRRGHGLQCPELDAPSHIGQQLELAASMGALDPAQQGELLARATSLQSRRAKGPPVQGSCFSMQQHKASHEVALDPSRDAMLRGVYCNPRDASYRKEQLRAYHHQQAVLRYEQTLPRRRAVDPYVSLTGAQVDTRLAVPNSYTADKLAARHEGRWVLDNPHRQQLHRGQPIMSRVMQGEYYVQAQSPRRGRSRGGAYDAVRANRREVRIASQLNGLERQAAAAAAANGPCCCACGPN